MSGAPKFLAKTDQILRAVEDLDLMDLDLMDPAGVEDAELPAAVRGCAHTPADLAPPFAVVSARHRLVAVDGAAGAVLAVPWAAIAVLTCNLSEPPWNSSCGGDCVSHLPAATVGRIEPDGLEPLCAGRLPHAGGRRQDVAALARGVVPC